MVQFCPECGALLRKNSCPCGYNAPSTVVKGDSNIILNYIWDPPSTNMLYCKITGTPYEKLKFEISKGNYPEKLKEIREDIKDHKYTCRNCVYYNHEKSHCKLKNKYFKDDSICKSIELFGV